MRKPTQHRADILRLTQTKSAKEVAKELGVPIGTVKSVMSRSGLGRNNERLRAFFKLPEPKVSSCTEVAIAPPLPEKKAVTGIKEVDAMLWLTEVIETGDSDLIDKALEAAKRIKTPRKELAKQYDSWLMAQPGAHPLVVMMATSGFGDLESKAEGAISRAKSNKDSIARFGSKDEFWKKSEQEEFCVSLMSTYPKYALHEDGKWTEIKYEDRDALIYSVFNAADYLPHTLSDCLYELRYWDSIYDLRRTMCDRGSYYDHRQEVDDRTSFLKMKLGTLRVRSEEERQEIFDFLNAEDFDCLQYDYGKAIIERLIFG